MPTRPKTNRKLGPPSKKNEAIIKRLIAAAKLGLPYAIVATRAGITRETLGQWRSKDADLDRQLEEARAEAAELAWKKIMAAGDSGLPNAWQSIAWRLERGFPDSFSKPELQLNAQFNSSTTTNNVLVISVEAANDLERRAAPVNREIDALAKAYEAKRSQATGTNGAIREVEAKSSLVTDGPISLPRSPTTSWWRSLSSGSGDRSITPQAAEFVLRSIVPGVRIDIGDSDPTLGELWSALAQAAGPAGWQMLVKKGEA